MPKEVYCIECGDYKPFILKSAEMTICIRDTTFTYLELMAYCTECGKELYIPEIANINVISREEAYQKAKA